MIEVKLAPGAEAVYIGIQRPYMGTVESIGYADDLLGATTRISLRLRDNTEMQVNLDRFLVPRKAYSSRSWDGWVVKPYKWVAPSGAPPMS